MKKLIVLLVGFIMITSLANAEIIYNKDDFTGEKSISSKVSSVAEFKMVNLYINEGATLLALFRVDKDIYYFNDDALIKIDGEIYDLPHLTTISKVAYGHIITVGIYSINHLNDKIKNANEIEIRINYLINPPTTFKLNNEMLEEWKEVLGKRVK